MMNCLPEALSPCANVRRSCRSLMNDEPSFFENGTAKGQEEGQEGPRSVIINSTKLDSLAHKISQSIMEDSKKKDKAKNDQLNSSSLTDLLDLDTFQFAAWDADNWHYTGDNYSRPNLTLQEEQKQRYERVALYIIVLDSINFCFWPVGDGDDGSELAGKEARPQKNFLEYEHLAMALKAIAEQDDVISGENEDDTNTNRPVYKSNDEKLKSMSNPITKAEDSYAFAPQNLINLTQSKFYNMVKSRLPTHDDDDDDGNDSSGTFEIPNSAERARLLVEFAQALITFHSNSATSLISKANQSSDSFVNLIIQSCPGFRDTAVDRHKGRWVAFYKRAQILCADLWAALGNGQPDGSSTTGISTNRQFLDYCYFQDISKITTFPDYRVPQLLRHLDVLVYSPSLSKKVDCHMELMPSCADELYIRASTVIAVDQLVDSVRKKLYQNPAENKDGKEFEEALANSVNAVKVDWYLWNIGEKLDRVGSLKPHHLVRTIFY